MQLIIDLGKAPLWNKPLALGMAVRFMLQATTEIDLKVLEINRSAHKKSGGRVPLIPPLYLSGVRYKEEPRNWDLEHFDTIPVIYGRKWGDCDDLAPARCAELRFSGEDPKANIMVKWKTLPDSRKLYHVLVRRSHVNPALLRQHCIVRDKQGYYEDPSRVLGMSGGPAALAHAGL